jgi:hypothetical protein
MVWTTNRWSWNKDYGVKFNSLKEQKLDYSHIHENLEIYSTPVNGRGLVYGV